MKCYLQDTTGLHEAQAQLVNDHMCRVTTNDGTNSITLYNWYVISKYEQDEYPTFYQLDEEAIGFSETYIDQLCEHSGIMTGRG